MVYSWEVISFLRCCGLFSILLTADRVLMTVQSVVPADVNAALDVRDAKYTEQGYVLTEQSGWK